MNLDDIPMPEPTGGGGFGSFGGPGQREQTLVKSDEVKDPWRVWVRSSLVATIVSFGVYLGIILLWNFIAWGIAQQEKQYLWTMNKGWYAFSRSWEMTWKMIRVTYLLPVLNSIGTMVYHAWILLTYRYTVEQKNKHWPPPYKAADVSESGALDFYNADDRRIDRGYEGEPVVEYTRLDVWVSDETGAHKKRTQAVPNTVAWRNYCAAMAGGESLSEPSARKYGISGAEYRNVSRQLTSDGFAQYRDVTNTKLGMVLTQEGIAMVQNIALGIGKGAPVGYAPEGVQPSYGDVAQKQGKQAQKQDRGDSEDQGETP